MLPRVLIAFALPALALAQNLVKNGAFESGDFTSWTTAGSLVVEDAPSNAGLPAGTAYMADLYGSDPANLDMLGQDLVANASAFRRPPFELTD